MTGREVQLVIAGTLGTDGTITRSSPCSQQFTVGEALED